MPKITLNMEFFAGDVEKICGVKRNRLQVWMEKGWIIPSIKRADGHGTRNIFNLINLFQISLFKKAVENGISRKVAADFLPRLLIYFKDDAFFELFDKAKNYGHPFWVFFFLQLFYVQTFRWAYS